MQVDRLHVVVGIADDVVLAHVDRALGAVGVLPAPEPHGIARRGDHHALVDIEGPAVVARQPGHVGGVGDDQQLDPAMLHRLARLGQTLGVLLPAEIQYDIRHSRTTPFGKKSLNGTL